MTNLTDAQLTELLAEKCPECGHRQRDGEPGRHRSAGEWTTACTRGEGVSEARTEYPCPDPDCDWKLVETRAERIDLARFHGGDPFRTPSLTSPHVSSG
jgi:predicted RNA-binding Zn-ribbon protein involved in translation (DUF1610 family)